MSNKLTRGAAGSPHPAGLGRSWPWFLLALVAFLLGIAPAIYVGVQ